jgi:hypothetical protein
VDKRRNERKEKLLPGQKAKDMMDSLIDVEDENGRKLDDDEIIDILLMYLNAGHESSGHITMWATYFLQGHPKIFRKAKVSKLLASYYNFFLTTFSIFILKFYKVGIFSPFFLFITIILKSCCDVYKK